MAVTYSGRIEAKFTIPASTSVSVSNSGGGPTTSTLAAGSYYLTAAGGVSGLISTWQTQLNTDRTASPSIPGWIVSLSTTTGLVTIDCTSGDDIVCTAASGVGTWTEGAGTTNTASGDCSVEFTVGELSTYQIIGLATSNPDNDWIHLNFAWYLSQNVTNTAYVAESGASAVYTDGTYAIGDSFKIERVGTVINYYKRPVGTSTWLLRYTSATTSTGALLVDSSFLTPETASFRGVRFISAGVRVSPTWTLSANVTKTARTWSLSWTSTTLRNLLGFTADISAVNSAQTGTKQARGVWLPDCPLVIETNSTTHAPLMTDQRITVGPTGTTYGLVGNARYEQASLRYQYVPKAQTWEANATTANASLEFFLKDTQYGLGLSVFSVCSPVQIYDNAGDRLGSDITMAGWTILGVDSIAPKRTDARGYDGYWTVEIPRLVSSG